MNGIDVNINIKYDADDNVTFIRVIFASLIAFIAVFVSGWYDFLIQVYKVRNDEKYLKKYKKGEFKEKSAKEFLKNLKSW